jgi:hypothetical protein
MAKYVIKESQLKSAIKKIIAEELNEGLPGAIGNALMHTAKTAALGAFAPSILAQNAFEKSNNIINGSDTVVGTVDDFFGGNIGAGESTRAQDGKSGVQKDKEKGKKNTGLSDRDVAIIKRKYGEPETRGGLGKRLERKISYDQVNFLEHGKLARLGMHYPEVNNTVWAKKIEEATAAINRVEQSGGNVNWYLRQHAIRLRNWLNERDKAYEKYIKMKK